MVGILHPDGGRMRLYQSQPVDLDNDEIEHYYKAVATDEHSGGPEIVSRLIYDDLMHLWVCNEKDTILVCVTRFVDYPDGYRELLVAMMSGTNVTDTLAHEDIHGHLMKFAVRNACAQMTAYMKPHIWEKMRHRLPGYEEEYVVISLSPAVALRGES